MYLLVEDLALAEKLVAYPTKHIFLYFKGTVARDFRLQVFFINRTHLGPCFIY